MQLILRALGLYSGKTDGFFSTDLRDAIQQLETEYERPQTGQLTLETIKLIYSVVLDRQEREKARVASGKSEGISRSNSNPSIVSESVFSDIAESLEVLRLLSPDSEPQDTSSPPQRRAGSGITSKDSPLSPMTSPSSAAAAAAAATSPYRSSGSRSSASPIVLDGSVDPLEPLYRRLGGPSSASDSPADEVRIPYSLQVNIIL